MFERLKRDWNSLKRGKPGARFQEQYDRQRKEQESGAGRVLRIIAGFILFPVGVFFLAVPGPGLLVIAVGAVLIAREFKVAAKILDQVELRARLVVQWGKRRWRKLVDARRKVVSR